MRRLPLREDITVGSAAGVTLPKVENPPQVEHATEIVQIQAPAVPLGLTFGVKQDVLHVATMSPLSGQVRVGDVLLSINNMSAAGFTGYELGMKLEDLSLHRAGRLLRFESHVTRVATSSTPATSGTTGGDAPARASHDKEDEAAVQNLERFCSPRLLPVRLPEPLGPKLFILGEPILHRYYTVYDWKTQSIGFGLANNWRNTVNPADLANHRGKLPKEVDMLLMQQSLTATARRPVPSGDEDEVIMVQVTVSVAVKRKRMC
jgi:hypothetical protein